MTACGATLRRLGAGAATLEEVADRLVRHLYASLSIPRTGEPACALIRLFKTTPYGLLPPDLQALADTQLGNTPDTSSLPCLTLLASAGIVPGWNDPALSSRFRVIPLRSPEDVERLPMFSQLFRQLGASLPHPSKASRDVLLDPQEHTFNVFHVLQAEGSPYVPEQEEFVRKYGIRSVLGFGAPLPNGDLFSIILFSRDFIPESTAQLFKPLALSAGIALAPYAHSRATPLSTQQPLDGGPNRSDPSAVRQLHPQISELEKLLEVHEQTVAEQADRMELIIQEVRMGTWNWEISTGRMTFNERWATMLGYDPHELVPHVSTWEKLLHPHDRPAVLAAVTAHLRGETPVYASEHRLRTKAGGWHWVFDSGQVLARDAAGAPLRTAGIQLDISARIELEEALRQSDERFRQLVDHIDAVFWLTTADHSKWLYVSPAFETIWGVPCHLLYARPALWIEQVHPEDRHRVSIATACQAHLPYDEEYRIVTPTGRIRWIRERSFPIKDHEDRVYRLAGIAQDITEAKQLESQVRASERRFRSLVELSPHAVFVNCEDKIVFANHACVKLFGATAASQLIGKPVFDFIHQESHARTQEQLSTIRATNRTAPSIEDRFVGLDGSIIEVVVAAAPIPARRPRPVEPFRSRLRTRGSGGQR